MNWFDDYICACIGLATWRCDCWPPLQCQQAMIEALADMASWNARHVLCDVGGSVIEPDVFRVMTKEVWHK